jgi:hypothetical protein
VKGSGDYGFVLTAVDSAVSGGGTIDRFRIKIVNKVTGVVVYDNQMDTDDGSGLTSPGTVLGGGNIVIHSK